MGKAYDKEYHFNGGGGRCGTMICASCGKPIISSRGDDWMSSKKDCKDDAGWPDWKFVCYHRHCVDDQSGWEEIEKERDLAVARHAKQIDALQKLAGELGITSAIYFADLAAEALGCDDLHEDCY